MSRASSRATPRPPDCPKTVLKPVYRHPDGTFGAPKYVVPKRFVVIEGLLGYHTTELCDAHDVRVFLAPPEELRREWKIKRDTSKRGYGEQQVLAELDKREPDSAAFIRPQKRNADMIVCFQPGEDSEKLDVKLTLSGGLRHPDVSGLLDENDGQAITVEEERSGLRRLFIAGDLDPQRGAAIEEAVWSKMQFARQLRTERLGEFTVGAEQHRSESLAIVQVLILYHLVIAKATVAVGGDEASPQTEGKPVSSSSQLTAATAANAHA